MQEEKRFAADPNKEPGVTFISRGGGSSGGDVSRAAARYSISVAGGFEATIRNYKGAYVIGHGFDADWSGSAWTFDATDRSDGNWYYGYLYGNYNYCGWLLASNLQNKYASGNPYCSSTGTKISESSFAYVVNCLPQECDWGSGVRVDRCSSFGEYGNVRPFTATSASDKIRDISNPGYNYLVYWRYVSDDGKWALVMDDRYANGNGRWIFIWRACLPATLPTNYTRWYP